MLARMIFWPLTLALAACSSSTSIMQPDCHSCTTEEQTWKNFPFAALQGSWKGSVETARNERGAKQKEKKEKPVQLRFLKAADFFAAQRATCESVPAEAVVLNGLLWESSAAKPEYEAFLPAEEGRVAYGRISMENINGAKICRYRRLGRVMGQNRLALPTVAFSEASTGREIAAAGAPEREMTLEFLRFAPEEAKAQVFSADGRRPAAAEDQLKPTLLVRVFRTSHQSNEGRGQWKGSEETLFRLWKAE